MNKPGLRARMRAARLAFSPTPLLVPASFAERLRPGLVLATYRPMPGEADPAPLHETALAAGCSLALPRVEGRAQPLRFLAWTPGDPLDRGPFGIEQPSTDAPAAAPAIILTPLLAFDRSGARLGQGAGYYDAAFAGLPAAWRVGVAWSIQEVDYLPTDEWDVPLHAVVTEKEWITP